MAQVPNKDEYEMKSPDDWDDAPVKEVGQKGKDALWDAPSKWERVKSMWCSKPGIIGTVLVLAAVVVVVVVAATSGSGDGEVEAERVVDDLRLPPIDRSSDKVDVPTGAVEDIKKFTAKLPFKLSNILGENMLQSQASITFVFTRSVIALGSNFLDNSELIGPEIAAPAASPVRWFYNGKYSAAPPAQGRLRWVTTSILRFDPEGEWPTELDFGVGVNPGLKAWDGSEIDAEGSVGDSPFKTRDTTFSFQVDSPMADAATDGQWRSYYNPPGSSGSKYEIPPDATLRLRFSSWVRKENVQQALGFVREGHGPLNSKEVEYDESCERSDRCNLVVVTPPSLEDNTAYSLTVHKGSDLGGGNLTHSEFKDNLIGRVPFVFDWSVGGVFRHNTQRMQVRHGLPDSVTSSILASSISVVELAADGSTAPTSVTVEREANSKMQIVLKGAMDPAKKYKVVIAGSENLKDGFGMPLVADSRMLEAGKPYGRSSIPQSGHFAVGQSEARPPIVAIVGGESDSEEEVELVEVDLSSETQLSEAMKVMHGRNCRDSPIFKSTTPVRPSTPLAGRATQHIFTNALRTGMAVARMTSKYVHSCGLYTAGNLAFTSQNSDNMMRVYVYNTETLDAVSGADVHVLLADGVGWPQKAKSGSDGVASFRTTRNGRVYIIAMQGNNVAQTQQYTYSSSRSEASNEDQAVGKVVVDRNAYRRGDVIGVKLYARSTSGSTLDLEGGEATCTIWYDSTKTQKETLQYDPKYGTGHASFKVPDDAEPKKISITCTGRDSTLGRTFNAGAQITIIDVRIPTVKLTASSASPMYSPAENVAKVNLTTALYTGTPVRDAKVDLKWKVSGFAYGTNDETGPAREGAVEAPVASGQAVYPLALPQATRQYLSELLSAPGSGPLTLEVEARWFGPSREWVTETATFPVRDTAWELTGEVGGQPTIIPGVSSDVTLTLTATENRWAPRGAAHPIEAKLFSIDDDEKMKLTAAEMWAQLPVERVLATTELKAVGGESPTFEASEELKVGAPGRMAVVFRARDLDGKTVYSSPAFCGLTLEEWRYNPIASATWTQLGGGAPQFSLETRPAQGGEGHEMRVAVRSPFKSGTANLKVFVQAAGELEVVSKPAVQNGADATAWFQPPAWCTDSAKCWTRAFLFGREENLEELPAAGVPLSSYRELKFPMVLQSGNLHLPDLHAPAPPAPLSVTVDAPASTLPDADASFTVQVDSEGSPAPSAEVTAWVSFRPVADLIPHAHPSGADMAAAFTRDKNRAGGTWNGLLIEYIGSTLGLYVDMMAGKFGLDYWTDADYNHFPRSYGTSYHRSAALQVGCMSNSITSGTTYSYQHQALCDGKTGLPSRPENPVFKNFGFLESAVADSGMVGGAGGVATPTASPGTHMMRGPASSPAQPAVPKGAVRSNFKGLATFQAKLVTDAAGKVVVNFRAPSNIGMWDIKVVAVSAEGGFGTAEDSMAASKRVGVRSSMPMQVRVGDTFTAGVTLTLEEDTASSEEYKVSVSFPDPVASTLALQAASGSGAEVAPTALTKAVTLKPMVPQEVLFGFLCTGVGDTRVTFSLTTNTGTQLDSMEHKTPSSGVQRPVFLATSFALKGVSGEEASQAAEAVRLPDAAPGTGTVSLDAGVGYMQTVFELTAMINHTAQEERPRPAFSLDLVAALAGPMVLGRYGEQKAGYAEELGRLGADLVRKLGSYTSSAKGLQSFPLYMTAYPSASIGMNSQALLVHRILAGRSIGGNRVFKGDPSGPSSALVEQMGGMADQWRRGLVAGLSESYQRWVECTEKYDHCSKGWLRDLPLARLVWDGELSEAAGLPQPAHFTEQAMLDSLTDKRAYVGATGRLYVALALTEEQRHPEMVAQILTEAEKSSRVQGRTAYLAFSAGSPHAQPLRHQMLAVWAFLSAHTKPVLLQKYTAYVAMGGIHSDSGSSFRVSPFFRPSSLEAAIQSSVLASYDYEMGSSSPDLELSVSTESRAEGYTPVSLLRKRFVKSDEVANAEASFRSLRPAPQDTDVEGRDEVALRMSAIGNGEVSLVLGLGFTPAQGSPHPISHGLLVQKTVLVIGDDGKRRPKGEGEALAPGQMLEVVLEVHTADDLDGEVVVVDGLPAAWEARDPNIDTQPAEGMMVLGFDGGAMPSRGAGATSAPLPFWKLFPGWNPWRWVFQNTIVSSRSVTFTAPRMPAGSHTCTYTAIVTTSGSFSVPPTHAHYALQPEVMGLSPTTKVEVEQRA